MLYYQTKVRLLSKLFKKIVTLFQYSIREIRGNKTDPTVYKLGPHGPIDEVGIG